MRRRTLAAVAALAAQAIPAVLLLAWLLATGMAWEAPSSAPLVLLVSGALLLALFAIWSAKRWLAPVTSEAIAGSAEERLALDAGSIRGLLELERRLPSGTSEALYRRAEQRLSQRVNGLPPDDVAGAVGQRARVRFRRAMAAIAVTIAVVLSLGFAAPERAREAWTPLLHPVAHLRPPPLPPLSVTPGDHTVRRGASVEILVRAAERERATVHWRATGELPGRRVVRLTGGTGSTNLGPIEAPVRYWATAPDGAVSDTFQIRPVDPLLLGALQVELVFPAYLQRAPERWDSEIPPLRIPAGTALRIRGEATHALQEAALLRDSDGELVRFAVQGTGFAGRWTPASSGVYRWRLAAAAGIPGEQDLEPLEITLIADEAPRVEIVFPGLDTLLPPDLKQPLTAEAADDHGVSAATLVSWRVSGLGQRDPVVEDRIEVGPSAERMSLRTLLDANGRRLLPGDTLRYFVRVADNSPARRTGESRVYALRFPGHEELRTQAEAEAEQLIESADEVARAARDLREDTRNLQRRSGSAAGEPTSPRSRQARSGPAQENRSGMEFRQAEEARQVLERQRELLQETEELRARAERLERAMEAAGLKDPELQRRLSELRELYSEVLTPELRERLAKLQQALNELDEERVREALEQVAQAQEELQQKLDQSLELLRRAALEQRMNATARDISQLATEQEALAADMAASDSAGADRAAAQESLGERAESLAGRVGELQQDLARQGNQGAGEQAEQAAGEVNAAREAMERAASEAESRRGAQAGKSGEQAAESLRQAAESLQSARTSLAKSWRSEVEEELEQATSDALSLAQRQNSLLQQMQSADQQSGGGGGAKAQSLRGEQSALQQGLESLGRTLSEAGQRSAMVDREVGAALGRAMMNAQRTNEGLEQAALGGQRLPVPEAERTLDAINQLALALLANRERVGSEQAGTGLQQLLQELAELAQQQGELNGQTGSLLPLNLAPQVLSQQLQKLATEQRSIAQKLGGMENGRNGRDDVLGRLDEMAREAETLARDMSGGRISPELLARQERLFHRLLDAGRTLERDETTDERTARGAEGVAPARAEALDPELLRGGPRFPLPSAEQLRELPPAYRRLILEYFERLNDTARTEGEGRPAATGGRR